MNCKFTHFSLVLIPALFYTFFCLTAASAQSPFQGNPVSINVISPIIEIDPSEIKKAKVKKAEQSLFPCEGTINCQYAQNVRKGPWGEIMTTYKPGTKVTILGREDKWYIINHNGKKAYLHVSLVDTPHTPAYDGYHPYAYDKNDTKTNTQTATQSSPQNSETQSGSGVNGINGPGIPDCILKGIEEAKKSKWFTTKDKCLQYAGTIAYKAGANVSAGNSIYPHNAYKPDKTLRGSRILDLKDAALNGTLKPGMLIHVKAAYDKDPAYNPSTNAHHWFMYVGLKDGVPMFADTQNKGNLQTIENVNRIMSGGRILLDDYKSYGNIRRVSAIYDPFADQR